MKAAFEWVKRKSKMLVGSGALVSALLWVGTELWAGVKAEAQRVRTELANARDTSARLDVWREEHEKAHAAFVRAVERNDERVYMELQKLQKMQVELLMLMRRADQRTEVK